MSKADALKAVAAGDKKLDIVTMLTPEDARSFNGNGHAHIQSKNAKTVLAAVFNQTKADSPFKTIEVRKAANMVVDRAALLRDAGGGYGVQMPGFIQEGRFGYNPDIKQYDHAPDQAKAVFKTAGLEGKTLTIGAGPDYAALVKQMGEEFSEAGITLKQVDAKDKNADMTLVWHFDWSPGYPVGVVFREFYGTGGGFNEGSETKTFDEMADKIIATTDLKTQEKLVQQLDAYEHDQANVLFLYSPATLFAVSDRTIFTPYDTFMFEGAEIKLKQTKAEK